MSWGDDPESRNKALEMMSSAANQYQIVPQSTELAEAYFPQDFSNLQPNVSGRPGLTRRDYEYFRENERIPTKHKGIIAAAQSSYETVGLIRNVIDIMGDFACQGIRLAHPNKRIEKFFNNWFARVEGPERSERFVNNFYRLGNVIVHKQTAKLTLSDKDKISKSIAKVSKPDIDKVGHVEYSKNVIPWKYTFLNPITIEVIGGPLAFFVGKKIYAIDLPAGLKKLITNRSRHPEVQKLVAQLPDIIRQAAMSNSPVPLDENKTKVYYYKKDDWFEWSKPMIYSILTDILLLQKLKLADMAALDGAISNIRIFKLGSLEHKIAPNPSVVSKLAAMLQANVGAGTMDLIWGPDLELVESKSTVHQFLGEEKYKPTLNNIYAGLGIPPTLTGTFGAAGTTNNFISLKTLTQRLEYGRKTLTKFWNEEIAEVQKAMGFRFPATVEFDRTNLSDEDAEKALLIQLADRNLISDELLQRRFQNDPNMEKIRLNRERKDRETNRMVNKAGPFFDPEFESALRKIALQTGVVTPSELGVKLEPRKSGEKPALLMKQPVGVPGKSTPKKKGVPQSGRPKNSKDSKKRKTKTFKPVKSNESVGSVELHRIWATDAQEIISKTLNPGILIQYKKKNMRSLTATQTEQMELLKFGVLYHMEPLSVITTESIADALSCGGIDEVVYNQYEVTVNEVSDELDRALTVDELRQIQSLVYVNNRG